MFSGSPFPTAMIASLPTKLKLKPRLLATAFASPSSASLKTSKLNGNCSYARSKPYREAPICVVDCRCAALNCNGPWFFTGTHRPRRTTRTIKLLNFTEFACLVTQNILSKRRGDQNGDGS